MKFDVDANGILNVSAKDLGTGKEQTVRIEQSSGLNEAEIERMRKDAEAHASEDKHKRDLAETRNKGESMAFQLEKLMKEHKDKLTDADRAPLEAAIKKVREVAKRKISTRSNRPSTNSSKLRTPSARACTRSAAGAGSWRQRRRRRRPAAPMPARASRRRRSDRRRVRSERISNQPVGIARIRAATS